MLWAPSAGRSPGLRGHLLLAGADGSIVWERPIDAATTGLRAPSSRPTRPGLTPDGATIVLGLDGVVVLLATEDGRALAVRPVDGRVDTAAATGDTLILATDRGLRLMPFPR
ncbi:hypothetical protein AB0J83_20170 [Actinoplanes sp. NPDC049596]|uniref:hypothetical protein n=1 Tax=unclassified Actinoplanes TaxID=2626549 RepID=UPI003425C79D